MCSIGKPCKNTRARNWIPSYQALIEILIWRHSFCPGLLGPELAAATPRLSNKARVAVVHSPGRWFYWGLSQHGRSCVHRPSSAEEIKIRPDVAAGEVTVSISAFQLTK